MRRIGSAVLTLWAVAALGAEVEFYQTVDRNQVGTEDTFRLDIVIGDAPEGAQVAFPASNDFEVLTRSESTHISYQIVGGAGTVKRVRKHSIVMRANRAGTLTIPASVLTAGGKTWKTEAIKLTVVKGRTAPAEPPPQAQKGPPGFPGFPFDDDEGFFPPGFGQEPQIPRSDSDLFLRASVDKEEVWVGEQVTLTLTIYSRLDLSGVDGITLPKLDGFWAEDLAAPTQMAPEYKTISGVQYRAYLLRQKAIFPVKPGTVNIEPAECDITTGFLYAGRKMHRKSNPLTLKVKPLPPGGNTTNVGRWRLTWELSNSQVALGEPVNLKLSLEGRGNLKNVTVPKVSAPSSLKLYEPTTSDKVTVNKTQLGGRRAIEYVVVPQQTGTFTIPGVVVPFFNVETGKYEETRTDPLTLTVTPGTGGSQVTSLPGSLVPETGPKNQLVGGGAKPVRLTSKFEAPKRPIFDEPWFFPLAGAPVALSLGAALVSMLRGSWGKENEASTRKKKTKAARARLAAAEKILSTGKTGDFYAEVEKGLLAFLEAKLGVPVQGLTRDKLDEVMKERLVPEAERQRVLGVFQECEMGRFAPGMGEMSARQKAIADAMAAMEAWP